MCVPCGSGEACAGLSGRRGVDFRFLFAYCRKSGKGVTFMDRTEVYPALPTLPWRLPRRGLVLFEGDSDVPRLSHYFLPRLVLGGQEILFLDGAHCADPREMARLARRRGIPFETFRRSVQIARAFTCFQLTELIRRVPEFMDRFPAQVLMVTAFPDLYYDQDIGEGEARGAFEQALLDLHRWSRPGRRARTVATFRDLIEQELQTWQRTFGRALRREERAYLESMFHRVRLYAQACTYQFPVNAMEAINVAIGLDHEIRLRAIEACLGINLETQWMDSRPIPAARGDGDLADRIEPEPASSD